MAGQTLKLLSGKHTQLESQSTDMLRGEGISLTSSYRCSNQKSQQWVSGAQRQPEGSEERTCGWGGHPGSTSEGLGDSCRDRDTLPVGERPNEKA